MSDDRLLERVEVLARRSNEIERLHMSESAAGKRITAARVARRFPVVLELIARGEIHLTAVAPRPDLPSRVVALPRRAP